MKINLLLLLIFFGSFTAKSQTFFTQDFSSGIPPGWTNVDQSGNNVLWRTTTTGSHNGSQLVDSILNPVGTSAANGYLIMDSDSAGQLSMQESYLTTTAINCSGHNFVRLRFNEYFAQYLTSSGSVSVSNDNVTWTTVHQPHLGLGLNQSTPNPNLVDVDITTVAANQSSVYVRFYYHGEWDYWWYVDDVELYEPPATDLETIEMKKLNSEYTLIPLAQATSLTLEGTVRNNGTTSATGATALFEVINTTSSQTVFSETINLPAIAPGASQSVVPTTSFVPAVTGNHKSRITVTIAGDANAANDMKESDLQELSDTVYSRDDDTFAGTQGVGLGPGEDAIMGQNFRVNATDNLSSITFFMGEGFAAQPAGTPVYFTVHAQTDTSVNPSANVIAYSDTILFTPGMIPVGGAYYTVHIQGGYVQLTPGLYFIGIHETDSILTIGYSNSIFSPGAVWVHWNTIPSPPAINGWAQAEDFTLQMAYMIRANFGDGNVGISNYHDDIRLSVYPNPASDKVYMHIGSNGGSSSYSFRIINMQGRVEKEGMIIPNYLQSINVEGMSAGIYNIVVYTSNGVVTRKITIMN